MARQLKQGTRVKWKWGTGWVYGRVADSYSRKVTRNIEGQVITRRGTVDEPVYLIEQAGGGNVLKLHYEVERD